MIEVRIQTSSVSIANTGIMKNADAHRRKNITGTDVKRLYGMIRNVLLTPMLIITTGSRWQCLTNITIEKQRGTGMKINICGIPYKVKEVPAIDEELEGIVQGKIIYRKCLIKIRKDLPKKLKKSVLYHEILHGILMQLGYSELSADETLVQGLSNAIYQMFELKE